MHAAADVMNRHMQIHRRLLIFSQDAGRCVQHPVLLQRNAFGQTGFQADA